MTPVFSELNSAVFNLLSQSSSSFIFIGDIHTGQYRWSGNAVEEFALPGESFSAPDIWRELIHPEDYEDFSHSCAVLAEDGQKLCGEYRIKRWDGSFTRMYLNAWMIFGEGQDPPLFAGIINDILQKRTEDVTTGFPNTYDFRIALMDMSRKQTPWVVMVLGIDDFKGINDLYSYTFGDQVLRAFALEIRNAVPEETLCYRLDGDGFGLLFPDGNKGVALELYHRLSQTFASPVEIGGTSITFTISGGLCVYPEDGEDGEILYRNARMSLRTAKNHGKNQMVIYSDEISQKERFYMKLSEKLRESVVMGFRGFSLAYQPLIQSKNGSLYGCEVLLRWDSPDFSDRVKPDDFVPILEESGLILEVGRWVFESAVQQCAVWLEKMPHFQMNINAASSQFEDPDFKYFVLDTLEEYQVEPSAITLELTESGQIKNPDEVQNSFDFIRSQGIKTAFDDFGTGYASLGVFRVLSADELKIDRSFLERLTYDVTDQRLIAQLVNLCHSMNMSVCVEGIESQEIDAIVRQLGPELLQGYYYNEPMTAQEFTRCYFYDGEDETKGGESGAAAARGSQMEIDSGFKKGAERGTEVRAADTVEAVSFRPVRSLNLDELLDHAFAGILQAGCGQDFPLITCNEGFWHMLGYAAEEINWGQGTGLLDFVCPEDQGYVNQKLQGRNMPGERVSARFRMKRSDGASVPVVCSGYVAGGDFWNPSLILVMVEDVDS